MKSKVFRGSWIPQTDTTRNQTWFCPVCGGKVYMQPGSPTYPTCPWCLSDMPEVDDFDTPEELAEAKRRNHGATNKIYSTDPADAERKRKYQNKYYLQHAEELKARARQRYADNRDAELERQKRYREKHLDEKREYDREYHAAHREERNAKQRERYAANPEKYREMKKKERGKPMREVMAHIYGVAVEDIPKNHLRYGKGRYQDEPD